MKTLSTFLISILICGAALAQAPAIQWQKTIGIGDGAFALCVTSTADSGYIAAGYFSSGVHPDEDCFVSKFSKAGSLLWQKTFGGSAPDRATSIQSTPDGGFIIAGITSSNDGDVTINKGATDGWLVKFDDNGNIEWQKTYGTENYDEFYAIEDTPDGGYIAVGDSNGSAWILKIGSTGNIEWQKTFLDGNIAYDLKLASDGGYIIVGINVKTNPNTQMWALKIDGSGILQWEGTYGGSNIENAASVQLSTDGGYILAGYSTSSTGPFKSNHGKNDYLAVKVDAAGKLQWQKLFGGSKDDLASSVLTTPDGGCIVAGFTQSSDGDITSSHGNTDYWLVKLDNKGNIVWQKTYGGSGFDQLYALQPARAGGYIAVGYSTSNDGDVSGGTAGVADAWVVKFGPDIMPLTFNSFTAQKQKTAVLLQWQTATEQNSSMFNIQRSTDGAHFNTICSTKAAGNSAALLNYSYTDISAAAANASILYYRIEEADADGRKTYTGIAKVNYDNSSLSFALVPNPVNAVIRFTASKDVAAAVIKLADINGKTVYSATKHLYASAINEIPAATLAAGMYMLTIKADGVKTSLKVVKE